MARMARMSGEYLWGSSRIANGRGIAEEPRMFLKAFIINLESETPEMLDKALNSCARVAFAQNVNLPDT